MVLGVVPGEEDVTVAAGVLDRAEALRELSPREVAAVPAPPTPSVAFARRGRLPNQPDGDNYRYLPASGRLVAARSRLAHCADAPCVGDPRYLDVRAMNGCPAKAVGSIAGDADKALGHGLAPSRGSEKRRSSGAWAGSTRPRHPLSSSAQNHLRAPARQPGLGSAECLWRRSEPLTRSRRRRLRARWRDVHFRSPDPQEFYSRGALRRRIPLLLRRVVGVKAHGTSAEHSVVRIPASFPAPARERCRSRCPCL